MCSITGFKNGFIAGYQGAGDKLMTTSGKFVRCVLFIGSHRESDRSSLNELLCAASLTHQVAHPGDRLTINTDENSGSVCSAEGVGGFIGGATVGALLSTTRSLKTIVSGVILYTMAQKILNKDDTDVDEIGENMLTAGEVILGVTFVGIALFTIVGAVWGASYGVTSDPSEREECC